MSGEETCYREKCSHKNCNRDQRIWLPETMTSLEEARTASGNHRSDVLLHHWCVHCGCVQNISDDRPKKIGYWINILSQIERQRPITQCQKRLIIKSLESNEFFEDMYATTGSAQRRVFVKIVQNYCKLGEHTIDSFIL
jgi:hypothetical protein